MKTQKVIRKLIKDRNLAFFQIIEKQNLKGIDNDIDLSLVHKRINIVKGNLRELSEDETLEWAQIQRKKINQMYALYKLNKLNKKGNAQSSLRLRQQLRILIFCSDVGIDYQAKEFQQMIREVYFDVYQQHVLPIFVKVGFPITQFETLQFEEQQIKTSWFRFLCCCTKKQKR